MTTNIALLLTVALAAGTATSSPPAHADGVPACQPAQVSATYRGTDAGMSHAFGRLVLRNTSARACSVHGFGGLSYVGHGDGTQVGAAADRDPTTPVRTVVVHPGHRVRSVVVETSVAPYEGACTRVAVDGFRVYLPDTRSSLFVEHPTTGCAEPGIHLLSHQAYR